MASERQIKTPENIRFSSRMTDGMRQEGVEVLPGHTFRAVSIRTSQLLLLQGDSEEESGGPQAGNRAWLSLGKRP